MFFLVIYQIPILRFMHPYHIKTLCTNKNNDVNWSSHNWVNLVSFTSLIPMKLIMDDGCMKKQLIQILWLNKLKLKDTILFKLDIKMTESYF